MSEPQDNAHNTGLHLNRVYKKHGRTELNKAGYNPQKDTQK